MRSWEPDRDRGAVRGKVFGFSQGHHVGSHLGERLMRVLHEMNALEE
jgi:hypothetical protein